MTSQIKRLTKFAATIITISFMFAACGDGSQEPKFEMAISGSVDAKLIDKTDAFEITLAAPPRGGLGRVSTHTFTFFRSGTEEDLAATITFFSKSPPISGTYTIATSLGTEGTVIASLSDRKSLSTFGAGPKGTITLTENEGRYSGELSFTAETFDGEKSVTVTGTFKNIALASEASEVSEE